MKKIIVAMRGRYKSEGGTAQQLEPQLSGLCNTLTSVQKDNLVLEVEEDETDCGERSMECGAEGDKSRNVPNCKLLQEKNEQF